MQLFEVVRWGNESDDVFTGGPNGPDTCFLVRASSVDEAASLVDHHLAKLPSEFVPPWSGAVYLLGAELSAQTDPRILRGPYIQHAYRHGWQHWYRDEQDGPWVKRTEA